MTEEDYYIHEELKNVYSQKSSEVNKFRIVFISVYIN